MHVEVLNITEKVRTKINVLLFVIIVNTVLFSVFPPCLLAYELTGYVNAEGRYFFNDTATTEIYTLSLHDALPISCSLKIPNQCFSHFDG